VIVAAGVSFAVASLLLGFGRGEKPEADQEDAAVEVADLPDAATSPTKSVS
jgi:hypothetical protein